VWFGGGKLAADLTLPRLRRRWTSADNFVPGLSAPGPLDGRHLSPRTRRVLLRTTVRRAADECRTTTEFLHRLRQDGLLVKPRYSQVDPGQITGYAVAFPAEPDGGEPTWYPGSRLADDLSLARLRQRWNSLAAHHTRTGDRDDLSFEERQAFYDDAARAAAFATAEIRRHLATNPYAAQDACWAASDALRVAAAVTGNRHLHRAADTYDRAARAPYGRMPRPTRAGDALRTAARLLALTGSTKNRTTVSTLLLVATFISLLDTVSELRRLQHRHAQAEAARKAAAHVREARPAADTPAPGPTARPEPASQARLAMTGFPNPWAPQTPASPTGPAPASPVRPTSPARRHP
jgi:hypothetical protein